MCCIKISCAGCYACYIRETTRHFTTWVREHLKTLAKLWFMSFCFIWGIIQNNRWSNIKPKKHCTFKNFNIKLSRSHFHESNESSYESISGFSPKVRIRVRVICVFFLSGWILWLMTHWTLISKLLIWEVSLCFNFLAIVIRIFSQLFYITYTTRTHIKHWRRQRFLPKRGCKTELRCVSYLLKFKYKSTIEQVIILNACAQFSTASNFIPFLVHLKVSYFHL